LIRANKFWVSLLVLIVLYNLNLYAPAVAFDGQKGECPACESSFIDNWEYPQDWELLWDPANPEEIGENSSVNVSVIGGVSPYKWSVNGTGFWLSSDQTEGLSNTLNADDIACGSATITVTDNFGDKVTGYMRCTNGQWVLKDQCGNDSGWNCTYLEGNKKWTLSWWCGTGDPGYNYCGMDCMCLCTSYWGKIACSGSPGGNCYPCWFVRANCHDPNNPHNYAWPAYWYYEWGCPP
jgi:hypothetical protein